MFRIMPQGRTITPGYTVIYPNREKAASHTTKAVVILIMLVAVALMLILTVGGWSKLQGLKPVNFVWCIAYLITAFYIGTRWARGLLPIVAVLALLALIMAVVAGTGASGTSWFDRSHYGFAPADSMFGGKGLSPDFLGLITVLMIPVQGLLIFFAMLGFRQGWNVELEVPIAEAQRRGYNVSGPPPAAPATA
jgi:lysylphosphatidylglycerol synthetase-like protein (DUF2156 family)